MNDEIAYQNKDILLKVLTKNYKDRTLKGLGLNLPEIEKVLPSDFPKITAEELRADNIFLLKNKKILILEYESTVKKENFAKYLRYILAVLETYFEEERASGIIVAVIYTGDIKSAPKNYNLDCLSLNIEQVFLSNFNSNEIYSSLKSKIESGGQLSDEDVVRFIILPLTEAGNEKKQVLIEKSVVLAETISNEEQRYNIILGMIVVSDKFIDRACFQRIKEKLAMTNIARFYEEDKIEAVKQAVTQERAKMAKILDFVRQGYSVDEAEKMFFQEEDKPTITD